MSGPVQSAAFALWLAAHAARRQFGECPYRAGEDYETGRLREQWFARRETAVRNACSPIYRDTRHALHYATRDRARRGQSNREGAKNRRWRKWEAQRAMDPHIIWPDYAIDQRDYAA
jgi:hypothetical protein